MSRSAGVVAVVLAVVFSLAAAVVQAVHPLAGVTVGGVPVDPVAVRGLFVAAVIAGVYAAYLLLLGWLTARASKRRAHDVRNILRFVLGGVGILGVLAVVTGQYLGALVSLGIVGFAVTFALQQPLLSLVAWIYIMTERPFGVGDRVKIADTKGDVIEVNFLVTTIWEINGELVSSSQPSGRVVTVPNSSVLSSQVVNYGGGGFPYVWNELSVQVAFETDLAFASSVVADAADDYLGDEMSARISTYRERLAETPVELEVQDRPSVNVVQRESWVELRLRYLTHPRRGTRVRNELYRRILDRLNDHPDRVKFPVGRNR